MRNLEFPSLFIYSGTTDDDLANNFDHRPVYITLIGLGPRILVTSFFVHLSRRVIQVEQPLRELGR